MIFHIAVCAGDPALRAVLRRHCEDYFARRATGCAVACFDSPEALLEQDAAGGRYELYLIELTGPAGCLPAGLSAAMELRQRGRRAPLAFAARSPAWAYYAYRADALQYLLCPVRYEPMAALLDRAVQPEYAPALVLPTAAGLRVLPFAQIEYVECTQHVVHFHLTTGEAVASLSQRAPFLQLAAPLLADGRFVQTHRSYLVNLAEVRSLTPGEVQTATGARLPLPQGPVPDPRRGPDRHRGAAAPAPRAGGRRPAGPGPLVWRDLRRVRAGFRPGPSPAGTSWSGTGC